MIEIVVASSVCPWSVDESECDIIDRYDGDETMLGLRLRLD